MSAGDRLLAVVTRRSRVVIAVSLAFTLVMAGGIAAIDDDTSLDQFETESPEAEKLEYAEDHFGVDEEDDTTTAQLLIRDDDVLDRESLIATLELQQDLRENETVDRTLADEPFGDLSTIVARTAMIEDRREELDERSDALENESDQLEAAFDELETEFERLENDSERLENESDDLEAAFEELEADAERLERRSDRLERDAAELESDREALEARIGVLGNELEEVAGIQREYEAGNVSESERDQLTDAALANATADAALDADQEEQFRAAAAEVQNLTGERIALEARAEENETRRAEAYERGVAVANDSDGERALAGGLDEAIELQTEYDRLNRSYAAGDVDEEEYSTRAAEIEEEIDGALTEASAAAGLNDTQEEEYRDAASVVRDATSDLDEVRFQLGVVGEELDAAFEAGTIGVFADELAELEERGESLERRGDSLSEDAEELDERREELEAWAEELDERGDELESRADALEDRQEELEAWADELEERGEALEEEYEQLAEIDPTTAEAIEQLESMNGSEVESQVESVLHEDAEDGVFVFLPTDHEPGSTQADARMVFVIQETPDAAAMEGEAPRTIEESQLAMATIGDDRFDDGFVFGSGIISDEMDRSLADSLAIVLPLALLFVSVVLAIAYRDLLDILLGMVGIVVVLVWTFGFVGWAGMAFNVVMVAVPVLLVGLSIDYAIHVFMRHREHRVDDSASPRGDDAKSSHRAMNVALGGVGIALIWVTATAVIGFLSNLVSPVAPIREFGVTSAFGIVSALVIFGALVPALKIETDAFLESRGVDRRKRAFGTGGGAFTRVLSLGQRAADRTPWTVVFVTLLLTGGGVAGASQIDTSFEQEDFIADDPPEWTKELPEPFAPGDYSAKTNLEYVNDNFVRQDSRAQVLIEGDVTDDRTLERIDAAEREVAETDTAVLLSDGDADVDSPLSTMEAVADRNETFDETFADADTTGDGVPDENVTAVYDALYEADEEAAANVVHRTDDGEYEAVRMVISIEGSASSDAVTEDVRGVAASLDGDGLEATATGQIVVFNVIENELFDTVIESLLVTLVAVFAFLMVVYRRLHGSALLGAITLLPIVFAVAWILGTMYLLGIPFNVMTGTITSLTVGLGIAYNIHMTERYALERRRGRDVLEALTVAVTGTGGALLGSAATTIGGFGVLLFAILPPLQQFGLITGLTILYAFLGSVYVLPSMLILWTRHVGSSRIEVSESGADAPVRTNGGDSREEADR